jgi:hypothetical protein
VKNVIAKSNNHLDISSMAAFCAAFTIHGRRMSGRRKNSRAIGRLPGDPRQRLLNQLADL